MKPMPRPVLVKASNIPQKPSLTNNQEHAVPIALCADHGLPGGVARHCNNISSVLGIRHDTAPWAYTSHYQSQPGSLDIRA